MNNNKEPAIKFVLEEEGGYTNNPSDPGGATNFGITIFDAHKYLNSNADIDYMKHMTVDQAIGIYGPKYWDKVRGDDLPSGLDYSVMDYAVNSGVGRAIPVLQRLVGEVDDGKFGPHTLEAVLKHDPKELINAINDERLAFLKRLRTWPVFGKGWGRRVENVRARSLKMAGV